MDSKRAILCHCEDPQRDREGIQINLTLARRF